MAFKDILKATVEAAGGGIGAVVMGYDGIAIDEYIDPDASLDVQLMAVEYSTVMKEIKRTVEVLKAGNMEEIAIKTSVAQMIIRSINEDFFVVLVMDNDGNFGKARYLLRRNVPNLLEVLS
jgi:predicted regulator of Ras-like GTPase activity (Roadblock/LC7/MglB family)